MSRSKKKTKVSANTNAATDKPFKVAENKRQRRAVRKAVAVGEEVLPSTKEFGNPWDAPKDGKHYFANSTDKDMRK